MDQPLKPARFNELTATAVVALRLGLVIIRRPAMIPVIPTDCRAARLFESLLWMTLYCRCRVRLLCFARLWRSVDGCLTRNWSEDGAAAFSPRKPWLTKTKWIPQIMESNSTKYLRRDRLRPVPMLHMHHSCIMQGHDMMHHCVSKASFFDIELFFLSRQQLFRTEIN